MLAQVVGRYRVHGRLGAGLIGEVLLAVAPDSAQQVAIKILSPQLLTHPEVVACFLDMEGSGQCLGQPGVAPILDHSQPTEPAVYVVTECFSAMTLTFRLQEQRSGTRLLDPLLILQQLATTLAAAHAHGLVHGDLHPGNVLLISVDGGPFQARLLDFAVARVAAAARRAGVGLSETRPEVLTYRAPEQSTAPGALFAPSDVYSLGQLWLAMLEHTPGHLASAASSHLAYSGAGGQGGGVQQLLVKMVAPDPKQRPTMSEVAAQLSAAIQSSGVSAAATAPSLNAAMAAPSFNAATTAVLNPATVPTVAHPLSAPLATTLYEAAAGPAASAPPTASTVMAEPTAPSVVSAPPTASTVMAEPTAPSVVSAPPTASTVVAAPTAPSVVSPPSITPPQSASQEGLPPPTIAASASSATPSRKPALPAPGSHLPPADFPVQLGQCIGTYRMVDVLGEGGMGVVFDAQHTRLSRRAAIKVLRPQFSRNPDMVARFFTEAESVNVINHPDIVSVYEFGQLPDQTVYIVMEFLQGHSLAKRIEKSGGRLGLKGLPLMRHVASAVAAAHAHNIIHRDLKPDNVMIIKDPDVPGGERAKVVDFGIAKMKPAGSVMAPAERPTKTLSDSQPGVNATRSGAVMGTPLYMSPEQFRDSAAVTDKADVYSLGVMLYEMLAGRLPFTTVSLAELAQAHQSATPPPLREVDSTIPAELIALIDRMLAKLPAQRPTMSEVAAVLDRLVLGPARMSAAKSAMIALGSAALLASLCVALYQGVWLKRVNLPALQARALIVLREGLSDADPAIRTRSAGLVGQSHDVSHASLLGPLLIDHDPLVQLQAAVGLRQLGARELVPALIQAVQRDGTAAPVRVQIAGTLADLGEPKGEAVLREALRSQDAEVRWQAVRLLADRGDRACRDLVLRDASLSQERVSVLGRLARFGDLEARAVLLRGMQRDDGAMDEEQLLCAEELARNAADDGLARGRLEQLAQKEGPSRLRAARILASLDDPSFYELFRERFASDRAPLGERILAAEGLGACGRTESALLLASVLPRESGRALRLRLAAAAALMQIAASDPGLLARASLNLIERSLVDANWDERVLATLALGDAPSNLGLPLLGKAIRDPESEVRRSAAYSLGRTQVGEAIPVLDLAIDDSAPAVRQEVIHAIGRVGKELRARGQSVKEAVRTVAARVDRGEPGERLVTVAALAALGDSTHRAQVQDWLHSPDPQIRQQAIVAWSVDSGTDAQPLRSALADPDFAVRFEAAAQLAERGTAAGVAVLQAGLTKGGAEAVRARGLLQKLGIETPGSLGFSAAPPAVRAAMVAAARYLAQDEALALLQQASHDNTAAVRLRTLEALADLAPLSRSEAGRKLLRLLLSDPNPMVRTDAGLLAGRLGISPRIEPPAKPSGKSAAESTRHATAPVAAPAVIVPAAPPEPSPSPDLATPDASAPASEKSAPAPTPNLPAPAGGQRGHLRIEAEPQVRFEIDHHGEQVAPQPPIVLAAGRHRVTHVHGTMEVTVLPGETVTLRIPVSLGDQALKDGIAAVARGDLNAARRALEQARGLLERGRSSPAQWHALYSYLGQVYEAQGRFILAMAAYEKLKGKIPASSLNAGQRKNLDEAVARVAAHLGKIRVSKLVDGQCQSTELWLEPGEHDLEDRGERKTVRVRAGEVTKVDGCQ